ncbi:hypothetical protein DFO83_103388 [Idiomarina loihiensis]|uniref:hypothetical protein n=1 Tax=Idiomarina TaxID=135575 RepID=UPI000D838FF2|nr:MULTISPECIES: hypothetical protein [Idiomarina]PWW39478.1 hypothetical protein DFO83_103388 [Idiomarina loihiensis]TDP49426.1 hypothetical protein DET58_10310 [Idiomarina loihiensis]TDS24259.1 hypothetical protein DET62_103388 [Idiomarina sp. H2]
MSDNNFGDNGHDSKFDTCVEHYLRELGCHSSWADAPENLLEQATQLAEKELGRERRG